jgi:hypothetical protein
MSWLGLPPMQLMMSCIVVLNMVYTCPVDPSPRKIRQHQRLQHILWREGDTFQLASGNSGRLQNNSNGREHSSASSRDAREADSEEGLEPIFCFETALKALYWSKFMYDYKQVREPRSPMGPHLPATLLCCIFPSPPGVVQGCVVTLRSVSLAKCWRSRHGSSVRLLSQSCACWLAG